MLHQILWVCRERSKQLRSYLYGFVQNVEGCKYVFICRTTMIIFVQTERLHCGAFKNLLCFLFFYIHVISPLVAFLSIE